MVCNSFGSLLCTTPLDSSNDNSIFSEILAVGETFSLTTKERLCFIFFDYIKNPPRLHMDMNLGFSSSVDFRIGGIGFLTKLLLSRNFALLKPFEVSE